LLLVHILELLLVYHVPNDHQMASNGTLLIIKITHKQCKY